ncbi:hypothetical protein CFC21_052964 [Triticum aestivum]|uniref:Dirigent protein n=2 Tax=Triticum aestivum TaxID=4565 RepID=A0A9R1GBN7_WHEAT|nr:hypothetical protein CFC21_052964 [Triticum aestivum]
MAKGAVMLLVLFTVLSAMSEAQPQHEPGHGILAHGHRWSNPEASPTHLYFYFHDTVSGASPSAVRVRTRRRGPFFGDGERDGRPADRWPGARLGGRGPRPGPVHGGGPGGARLPADHEPRELGEMPVVGGTGAFHFAHGYAQARTHWLDFETGDATVEYDVYVMH